MSYSYIFLTLLLGVIFPALSVWQGSSTKNFLIQHPEKLVSIFKQSISVQLVLTFLVLSSLYLNNDTIDKIGLSFIKSPLYSILLFTIAFICLWLLNRKSIDPNKIKSLKEKYADVYFLIPGNKRAFNWSIALSFAVGIMEEILYRGFLFWQLNMHMPLIAALILTNLVFGFLHFGTGKKNAIATFWLGLVYSGLSIPFDTLWIAILAHILTDIYAMVNGYKVKSVKATP